MKRYYVYMLADGRNRIIYTGVTNNLRQRVYEHKQGRVGGLVKKYGFVKLVYYEASETIVAAVNRQTVIKEATEKARGNLVGGFNAGWRDLYGQVCDWQPVR